MDKISCIVLNYNDAPTTLHLVRELKELDVLDSIVVVDNCSTDDSWEQLKELEREDGGRIYLLQTGKNGGYGFGNQAGLDFAAGRLGATHLMVANPDIHITRECLLRVKEALDGTEGCAMSSAMVRDPKGNPQLSYWKLLPLWRDLLDTGLVTRRVFKPLLTAPLKALFPGGDPGCRLADALPGSFFMLRADRFPEGAIHSIFDKNIFLYYEEKVLGRKLRDMGLKTVLVTDTFYVHAHSVSIDKTVGKILAKQKILHKSKLYYYKEYLHAGPVKLAAARVFLAAVLAEVWLLTEVFGLRW